LRLFLPVLFLADCCIYCYKLRATFIVLLQKPQLFEAVNAFLYFGCGPLQGSLFLSGKFEFDDAFNAFCAKNAGYAHIEVVQAVFPLQQRCTGQQLFSVAVQFRRRRPEYAL